MTTPSLDTPKLTTITEATKSNRTVDLFGNDDLFDNEPPIAQIKPAKPVTKSPLNDDIFDDNQPIKPVKSKPVKQAIDDDLFGDDQPVTIDEPFKEVKKSKSKPVTDDLFDNKPDKPIPDDDLFDEPTQPKVAAVKGLSDDLFKASTPAKSDESDLFTSLGPLPKPKSTEQSPVTVKKSKTKKETKPELKPDSVPSIFADVPTIDQEIVPPTQQPPVVDDIFASSPPAKKPEVEVMEINVY